MILRACNFEFVFPRSAVVMGVLNVTPDSFSDGGRFFNPETACAHAREMIEQGADIIDVGGESTRPNATPVDEEEELRRVIPVIDQLSKTCPLPLSIDTIKPGVARAAIAAGAVMVNDIAANQRSTAAPEMERVVAGTGAAYVCMHMQGTPPTMQKNPRYEDVVAEVNEFFGERLAHLEAAGLKAEQIIFDVGIGFGKSVEHNLQLLQGLGSFTKWQRPLLLGVSRKSFLGKLLGAPVLERLPASLACACWAVQHGVQIIRTHDVAATKQALGMIETLLTKSCGRKLP